MGDVTSEDIQREQRINDARKAMESAFAARNMPEARRQCAIFTNEIKKRSPAAQRGFCGFYAEAV